MSYVEQEAHVLYRSKDGKEEKIFDALEWLAAMCSHVPGKGEQMVRYGACPPWAELLQQRFSRQTEEAKRRQPHTLYPGAG